MSSKKFSVFIAGVTAGAILGILFAPDKGSATRERIAGTTDEFSSSVKMAFADFIDDLKQSVKTSFQKAEDEISELAPDASSLNRPSRFNEM